MRPNFFLIIASLLIFSAVPALAEPGAENAFSPYQGATELVIRTIGTAKKSIHVAAYTFTSQPIAAALAEAHRHGIEVEIVLDKSQRRARYSALPYFLKSGIPTRINYNYAIMHDKFMVIDGTTLELGSFNYTKAAEEKNAENVLVLHRDTDVIRQYENQWQKLWAEATALEQLASRE